MWYKKIFQICVLLFIIVPLSLNAQEEKNKDENKKTTEQAQTPEESNDRTGDQNRRLSSLNEEPNENIKNELRAIADKHANQIAEKINIEEDAKASIREEIAEYLDERWEKEIEIAKGSDPEEIQENSTELAYLRVELSQEIKDNLSDESKSQWKNHAVEFWKSLNSDIFSLQMEESGIATETTDEDTRMNY